MQAFYIRRILRIWPLYFIMVLFAFMTPVVLRLLSLTSSAEGYEPNWLLSVTFLENYKMIATNSFPNVSPLGVMWSVCVEEHFYILWALSLYFISTRNLFWLIACSIITANISRYVFYLHDRAFLDLLTNMDYFAYGAIPAWLLIQRKEEATVFFSSLSVTLKITVLIAGVGMIIILPNLNVEDKILMEPTILGSIYALLLTLIVFEEELFHIPQKNIFSRLGVYTYGFYLTHTIVINFFVKIFDTENVTPVVALLFITICLLGTVIAGMATYYSIERPFLKLKKRFS
ncbi:MAG: acyltransferase family protein [Cytophaga sp.]|uniref:acyltransferase family protein n=1 Tax=Cytophaga sp. TaxID=29535 RepID=UPI003F7F5A11